MVGKEKCAKGRLVREQCLVVIGQCLMENLVLFGEEKRVSDSKTLLS